MSFAEQVGSFKEWYRKPYYLFRPGQLIRRFAYRPGSGVSDEIRLPWGATIEYSRGDDLGFALETTGVYEIAVTETLWRLADVGDFTVDAGAHIGYMTSVMASRVGPEGSVLAFEPHPSVYSQLSGNVSGWTRNLGWSHVKTVPLALSSRSGAGVLFTDRSFERNSGLASLNQPSAESKGLRVTLTTLDEMIGPDGFVGVVKIDVEGHEYEALVGSENLLKTHRIRDLVFETRGDPSPSLNLLRTHGYQVFRLVRGLMKPLLKPADAPEAARFEAPNFIGTCDVERCASRLRPIGWRSLKRRHS